MRKQTKLVAALSATALLAIGASMTSFAAGWEKDEAGVWHYTDEDGEYVTNEWKKDGGKFFYLDEDGNMLTNDWVDGEYYVGEDGARLVNQWIKTYPDDTEDDVDAEEHWYYFASKGKLPETGFKKINGKTYYFENGYMQSGWQEVEGKQYYLGTEDDGARTNNAWLWLEKEIEDDNKVEVSCDECDDEAWYYFGYNTDKVVVTFDGNKVDTVDGKDAKTNAEVVAAYGKKSIDLYDKTFTTIAPVTAK